MHKRFSYVCLLGFILLVSGAAGQPADMGRLDPFHLYEIRIRTKDALWDKKLKAFKNLSRKDKLMVSITIDGTKVDSVGIRFKGNSSFNAVAKKGEKKLPFSLDANAFVKGQEFPGGYKGLKLSNCFRDPSYIRDVMSYFIARQYMPAPDCSMAKVYVNDEYFGVYTLTQDIDKGFLQHWFGEKDGTFVKCDPEWQAKPPAKCKLSDQCSLEDLGTDYKCYEPWYELKSSGGWKPFIQFIGDLNQSAPAFNRILDVDKVLWKLAFNNVLVNLDSYSGRLCHNYFMYQRRDGQFTPLIWDLNLSFGGFRMADKTSLTNAQMSTLDPLLHAENPRRPLIAKLLAVPRYRKIYAAHMRTILEEWFANGEYLKQMDQWRAMLDAAIKEEKTPLYPYAEYQRSLHHTVGEGETAIIGIVELMEKRITFLRENTALYGELPAFQSENNYCEEDTIFMQMEMHPDMTGWLYWRYQGDQMFQEVSLQKMAENQAEDPNVRFQTTIPLKSMPIEYYWVIENNLYAQVIPARGSSGFQIYIPD